jgi:hypothetical protein
MLVTASATAWSAEAPKLDDKFQGYWRNVDLKTNNWWLIGQGAALNFGASPDGLYCVRGKPKILGPASMDINFGNTAKVTLTIENDQLIFSIDGTKSSAVHKRVEPSDVCRLWTGRVLSGAPRATQ